MRLDQEKLGLLRTNDTYREVIPRCRLTTTRPKITVSADGAGLVPHAGLRLLADMADATTLAAELSEVLDGARGVRGALATVGVSTSYQLTKLGQSTRHAPWP